MNEEELKKLVDEKVRKALKEQEDQREKARKEQQERSQKYGIGVKDGGNVTKPSEYANLSDDQFADPVNYRYPVDAEHVQAALAYFNQPDNRRDYSAEEQVKILAKIVQAALAAGKEVQYQANDAVYKALPEELKSKLTGYQNENLGQGQGNVINSLVKNPPKTMPIEEAIKILEGLLPSPAVERSTMGMQRECQEIRHAILMLRERMKSG